jgi:hypothetical protein
MTAKTGEAVRLATPSYSHTHCARRKIVNDRSNDRQRFKIAKLTLRLEPLAMIIDERNENNLGVENWGNEQVR